MNARAGTAHWRAGLAFALPVVAALLVLGPWRLTDLGRAV